MNRYLSGNDVKLSQTVTGFTTENPTGCYYWVQDEDGNEIVARQSTAISNDAVSVTIPSVSNTLVVGVNRSLRSVSFEIQSPSGTVIVRQTYLVERDSDFEIPSESLVTYNKAMFHSASLSLEYWEAATELQRKLALRSASISIASLSFNVTTEFNIQDLTNAKWLALDSDFITAVEKATVAQADYVLLTQTAETAETLREQGIVKKKTGETSVEFASSSSGSIPAPRIVASNARRFLAKYLVGSGSAIIGRA